MSIPLGDITPMRAHGPGWTLEPREGQYPFYQVWAPQTRVMRDEERFPGMWSPDGIGWYSDDREPRDYWQAAITTESGYGSACEQGTTCEEALSRALFPVDLRRRFLQAIEGR